MEIWFTEIGEPLPLEADVRLHRYGIWTKALAARGHDVTWWTSNFSHAPKRFVCEGDRDYHVDGVTLRVLSGLGYPRNVSLARFRHQADFAKKFSVRAPSYKPPDLLISPIPTIETAALAMRYAKERGIPFLTDIRDEWPDDLANLAPGPLRPVGRLILRSFFKRMEYVCRGADGIMAISKRQLAHGLRYAARPQHESDGVFPFGYSSTRPDPAKMAEAAAWWRTQGVKDGTFLCCFFGTIGNFFDLDTVIGAARSLGPELNAQFVLCGDGSKLSYYRERAKDVPQVIFPGWVDAPRISALMAMADVGLAPYRSDAHSMSLPNKPSEYLSGGLPVVSSIQGELKELIEQHDCGLTYRSDSVAELCAALRSLHSAPDRASAMGNRGRKLFEERFDATVLLERVNQHLESIVLRKGKHPPRDSDKSYAVGRAHEVGNHASHPV